MQGDGALLEVKDLRTYFIGEEGTSRAVDGVSFKLQRGRTLCLAICAVVLGFNLFGDGLRDALDPKES